MSDSVTPNRSPVNRPLCPCVRSTCAPNCVLRVAEAKRAGLPRTESGGTSPAPLGLESRTLPGSPYESVYCVTVRDYRHGLAEFGFSKYRTPEGVKRVRRGDGDPLEREIRSLRRAKTVIRRKCLWGGQDRLFTCTYRAEVTDIRQVKRDLDAWEEKVRVRYPDWKSLKVPAIQPKRLKRTGVAVWHVHNAVRGYRDVTVLDGFWQEVVGAGMGNVDITRIGISKGGVPGKGKKGWRSGRPPGGRLAVAKYLSKNLAAYAGTNLESAPLNKKRYWQSAGVDEPDVMRVPLPTTWAGLISWVRDICNGYGWRFDPARFWTSDCGMFGRYATF